MDLELITIEPTSALVVFTTPKAIEPFLAKVREEIDGFSGDMMTAKGRAEIKSMAHKVTKVKTRLEAIGKQLADDQKEIPKKIDATRKLVRDTLDKWSDEVRKPVTEWEEAEEARIDRHKGTISRIEQLAGIAHLQIPAEQLRDALAEVDAVTVGPECEEYEAAYAKAKESAVAALTTGIAARERYDAEQAELAALRSAAEERAKKDREEQIARDAAEKATRDAEIKAAAEKQAVEDAARREREASEARELTLKRAAEDAELRAAEAEANALRRQEQQRLAERAEADRRKQDKERRKTINGAALAALVAGGVADETARTVLKLIITGAVPNVTITY
ncbi:hypothetical protein V5G24_20130 [Xanthobacter sp. VTT E-85241]|uniref:hypothetical protein n=1 Tax=Roseixanthobacter finlandensis TaxID=3119922 RepID=UPI003728DB50